MNTTPQTPYFGSFAADKRFLRVLFKPEHAVQARELNDLQAMAQHQVGVFADHIFKNGSRVSNARSRISRVNYVRLQDLDPVSLEALATAKEGDVVTGLASGVQGTLVAATQATGGDPSTLFVQYNKTGIDGVQTVFVPGEDVVVTRDSAAVLTASVRCPSCPGAEAGEIYPTGYSVFFTIDDGVFYYNKYFIDCARQMKILSKYPYPDDEEVGTIGKTEFAALRVGLDYVETYVTAGDDASLYDNALGYPNEANEGADRLKGELVLTVRAATASDSEEFIVLASIDEEGRTTSLKSDAEYSAIMDALAKRTYETNGNYTIRPFTTRFLNHRRAYAKDPSGWLVGGEDDLLVALVAPSVGYVLGYRVETVVDTPVLFRKARDTKRIPGAILPFTERAYVLMKPSAVIWPNPVAEKTMVSTTRVSLWNAVGGTGAQIGSFLVYNVALHSGTPGQIDAVYRYYFSDLVLAAGVTFNDVLSATVVATNFSAATVVTAATGRREIKNAQNTGLIYKLPFDHVKTLKSTNASSPGTMILTVRKKFRALLDATGSATLTSTTNQSFAAQLATTVGVLTTAGGVSTALPIDATTLAITSGQVVVTAGVGKAGSTVTLFLDVLVTNQLQNAKQLVESVFVGAAVPPNTKGSVVKLGAVDVTAVKSVKLYDHTNATPAFIADVTADWVLATGVTDYAYTESSVVKATDTAAYSSASRLHVEYKAFSHSGNTGFYTVDSYATMLVAPQGGGEAPLTYETLPVYTSRNAEVFPVASSLDFRPDLLATSTLDAVIPATNSTAIYEAEYYLPRTDMLCLRKDGALYVKQGLPSETPVAPTPDDDSMPLYQVILRPFTYSLSDVSTKFIENKRYTMRDIGKIEERVARVEYYTALSLLEAKTAALQTKDGAGLDRYKNGFLVDDFSGFQASDLNHPEFKAAVDPSRRELRPGFKARHVRLDPSVAKSSGVKWLGAVGMRDYVDESADVQPFATKHISVNPYFQVAKVGRLALLPNIDTWSDDTILPALTTEIDTGVDALRSVASAAGVLGTTWGSWQVQNTTVLGVDRNVSTRQSTASSTQSSVAVNGSATTVSTVRTNATTTNVTVATTTTVKNDLTRQGIDRSIDSRTQTYTTGEMVRSVAITPYCRAQVIKFFAAQLKPNTRVYAYFDDEDVSEYTRNAAVFVNAANVFDQRSLLALGSPLYTDVNGELVGEFHLPAGRFFTGQKAFRISADVNYADVRGGGGDEDAETTYAEALYFAGGVDTVKQESKLNLITPTFTAAQVSEGRSEVVSSTSRQSWQSTATTSSTSSQTTVAPTPAPVVPTFRETGGQGNSDPVAQSFVFSDDRFVTALNVYFAEVDAVNNKIFVELRSMLNGYPTTEVLARKDYLTDVVPTSADASVPHHVVFDYPVFCRGGIEYCLVVGGWSPDTRIWVARMGGKDITDPTRTVETQPTLGSSFRSQNGSTWNAEQLEDIKYEVFVARFAAGDIEAVFENTKAAVEDLVANPLEMQNGSPRVRVFHSSHGYVEGDKTRIDLLKTASFEVETSGTPPQSGQLITVPTGSGTIVSVLPLAASNRYELTVEKITGKFTTGQSFATGAATAWTDNYLLDAVGARTTTPPTQAGAIGAVITASHVDFVGEAVGGVPVETLQKEHIVVAVDSAGSYIIDVGTPAQYTGRIGGSKCAARDAALRYEVFNVSGSSLAYSSGESWNFTGLGHGRTGSVFAGDDYRALTAIEFVPGSDIHLVQPMKLANTAGEATNSVKSIVVRGAFTDFKSDYVSPMINADAFSATLITSIVDAESADAMNIIPNASNRFVAETDPVNGSAPYKYVSVVARLENPASDLRILLDAYKDVNADFRVFVKTQGESDTGSINDKSWVQVVMPTISDSVDLTDFKEHDVTLGTNVPGWASTFIAFQIKITGRTKNPCKPPIFRNLRAIALT